MAAEGGPGPPLFQNVFEEPSIITPSINDFSDRHSVVLLVKAIKNHVISKNQQPMARVVFASGLRKIPQQFAALCQPVNLRARGDWALTVEKFKDGRNVVS